MRKFFIVFIHAACSLLLAAFPAHANELSLEISPTLNIHETLPGSRVENQLVLENFANQSLELSVSYRQFTASTEENGEILYLPDDSPEFTRIKEYISLWDGENIIQTVKIQPEEKKKLRLVVDIPAQEPAADYYFSAIFTQRYTDQSPSSSSETTSKTFLEAGIASNILLSIGKRQVPDLFFDSFTPLNASEKPSSFFHEGPVDFNLRVKNNGTQLQKVKGSIEIRNIFGQKVGQLSLHPAYILANSARKINGSGNGLRWDETFILGSYQAQGVIYPERETETTGVKQNARLAQATFFAFPVGLFIKLVLSILCIFFIVKGVRKRLNQP